MGNWNRLNGLLLAGLLVLLASGCKPREEEAEKPLDLLGIGPKMQLKTGLDVGRTKVRWLDIKDGDMWETTSIRPFVSIGTYDKGLNWDLILRGLFSTKDEVDDTSVKVVQDGVDFRYRLGWGWKLTPTTTLNVLTGLGYRHVAMEFSNTQRADDPVEYSYDIISYTLGARASQNLGKRLSLTGEFTGDIALTGRADVDSSAGGVSSSNDIDRIDNGYILAGRVGLEWHVSQRFRLEAGAFMEQCRFRYEGGWDAEDEFTTSGGYFNLILRF